MYKESSAKIRGLPTGFLIDRIYNFLPMAVRSTVMRIWMRAMKPAMIAHFRQFIKSGDIVFDVGANIGDYSQIYSDLGATVIAIEPQPSCQKDLKTRFASNRNVTILPYGVGKVNSTLPFFISSANPASSTFSRQFITEGRYRHRMWDTTLQVPVVTLDHLAKTCGVPSFCKIDVEGYETQVLAGLHNPIHYLSFEFTRESLQDTETCVKYLEHLSYSATSKVHLSRPNSDIIGSGGVPLRRQTTQKNKVQFNVSFFYRFRFALPQWVSGDSLMQFLYQNKTPYLCGDVYASFGGDNGYG